MFPSIPLVPFGEVYEQMDTSGMFMNTPEAPMYRETTRARLLVEDQVEETDILVSELDQYERICLINVFRPLSIENSIALPGAIV